MRMRAGVRRGGAVFSAITGLVFYGFWALLASGAASFFADPGNAATLLPALSSGLLFVTLYWQLAPVISADFGASLDLRKLLALSDSTRQMLFTVEVLLRLTSCAEMLIILAGGVASACCAIRSWREGIRVHSRGALTFHCHEYSLFHRRTTT